MSLSHSLTKKTPAFLIRNLEEFLITQVSYVDFNNNFDDIYSDDKYQVLDKQMEAEFFKTGMNSVKKGRFGFVLVNDPNMDTRSLV